MLSSIVEYIVNILHSLSIYPENKGISYYSMKHRFYSKIPNSYLQGKHFKSWTPLFLWRSLLGAPKKVEIRERSRWFWYGLCFKNKLQKDTFDCFPVLETPESTLCHWISSFILIEAWIYDFLWSNLVQLNGFYLPVHLFWQLMDEFVHAHELPLAFAELTSK